MQGAKGVEGSHQLAAEGASTVACVLDDDQLAVWPRSVQMPCGVKGARDVIAAMDQDGGDAGKTVDVTQNLVFGEEAAVAPVVRDQPREGQLEVRIFVLKPRRRAGPQRDVRVFPYAPLMRRADTGLRIGMGEHPRVGGRQVPVALSRGEGADEPLPLAGKERLSPGS